MRLLIVEDDAELADALMAAFARHDIHCDHAGSASDALQMATATRYALIVLDLVCLLNMRDWLTDTFLQKTEKGADGDIAFYVKPGAFIALIWAATVLPLVGTGRFAYKRLAVDMNGSCTHVMAHGCGIGIEQRKYR